MRLTFLMSIEYKEPHTKRTHIKCEWCLQSERLMIMKMILNDMLSIFLCLLAFYSQVSYPLYTHKSASQCAIIAAAFFFMSRDDEKVISHFFLLFKAKKAMKFFLVSDLVLWMVARAHFYRLMIYFFILNA